MNYILVNRPYTFQGPTELPVRLKVLYEQLWYFGDRVESRLGVTKELIGASFELFPEDIHQLTRMTESLNPLNTSHSVHTLSAKSIDAEHDAVLAGKVGPISTRFNLPPSTLYADVVANKQALIDNLQDGSRNAVVTISPVSCWTSIQLLRRDNRLTAVLSARSLDAVNGLIPDVLFWHRYLLAPIAADLGLHFQAMMLNTGSLHVYAFDGARVRELAGIIEEEDELAA